MGAMGRAEPAAPRPLQAAVGWWVMSNAAPPEPKPAATVLLLRDAPAFQVLMVKRHHQVDFASNALVFPGGKTHAGDTDEKWAEHTIGCCAQTPNREHRGSTLRQSTCHAISRRSNNTTST